MVYIHSWQEYQEAAESLYARAPEKARYCVKWKPSEGKLVLKITDDSTCLKYKTHSSIYLNRFEALNLSLMQKMQNRRPAAPPESATPSRAAAMQVDGASRAGTPAPGGSNAAPVTGGTAGGGVKKKKPGKKKK